METEYKCPSCSGRLAVSSLNGVRQYVCESCSGHVLTVFGLRHLSPQAATALWADDDGPAPTSPARCPFCQRQMRARNFSTGQTAVCRPCESIWLDKQAAGAVKVPQPATSSLGQATRRCEHCGAVAEETPDGNCRYCGSPLNLPTRVVVIEGPPVPDPGRGRAGGLLGGLAGDFLGDILGWP